MWIGPGIGLLNGAARSGVDPFTFTVDPWVAEGSSGFSSFTLPLTTSTGLDVEVDWGDGSSDSITDHTVPEVTHTYAVEQEYTIKISGDIVGWRFNHGTDNGKMLEVQKWGQLNVGEYAFFGCARMTATATDAPLSVGSLYRTFMSTSQFNGQIGNWDVSSVTNMNSAFYGSVFNQDISGWDVSSVTNMAYMFKYTLFDQDISSWDISQVTDFTGFKQGTGLSTANYDALLIGWEQTLQSAYPDGSGYTPGRTIHFGGSRYTPGGLAEAAKASLETIYGWVITDGGEAT